MLALTFCLCPNTGGAYISSEILQWISPFPLTRARFPSPDDFAVFAIYHSFYIPRLTPIVHCQVRGFGVAKLFSRGKTSFRAWRVVVAAERKVDHQRQFDGQILLTVLRRVDGHNRSNSGFATAGLAFLASAPVASVV